MYAFRSNSLDTNSPRFICIALDFIASLHFLNVFEWMRIYSCLLYVLWGEDWLWLWECSLSNLSCSWFLHSSRPISLSSPKSLATATRSKLLVSTYKALKFSNSKSRTGKKNSVVTFATSVVKYSQLGLINWQMSLVSTRATAEIR